MKATSPLLLHYGNASFLKANFACLQFVGRPFASAPIQLDANWNAQDISSCIQDVF
jgi:hypothetical protein